MKYSNGGLTSFLWVPSLALVALLSGLAGCGSETPPAPPVSADVSPSTDVTPECRQLPDPSGPEVSFTKTPYLLAPVAGGVTFAFETLGDEPAWVGVWRSGDDCLVALVPTEPSRMPTTLEMMGEMIEMDPTEGHQHWAKVTGLEAGALYSYSVVVGSTVVPPREFRATPSAGQDYRVAIIGDTRTHDIDHQAVVDDLMPHAPDAVIHTGDLMTTAGILSDWEGFFAIEADLLARAPFLPAFGNHEAIFGHAYWRGYIDVPGAYNTDRRDYAFSYGNSHWIIYDSATAMDDARIEWITAKLIEGAQYPFSFVVFHHPFYSFSKHTPNLSKRELFHPLFVKHGVTAVWNGHNHCYEHFLVDGVHYLVVGGGGSSLYGTESSIVPGEESLRVAARQAHHHVLMDVIGEEAIVTVHDVDLNEPLETFVLTPR